MNALAVSNTLRQPQFLYVLEKVRRLIQTPFELGGRRDLGSLGVTSDWVFSIVPAPSCVGTINTELKSQQNLFLVPIADLFSYF